MWMSPLWLLSLFLTWTAADIGAADGSGPSESVGLSRGLPLHVLNALVDDQGSDNNRYDSPSAEETTKRTPKQLSRLGLGEGYSRFGRADLQQLMSSLGSEYSRNNRQGVVSLTRHNLDLGYSRYGRAPTQLSRNQLGGKGFNRYGRANTKSLSRHSLGTGYNRYGRSVEAGTLSPEGQQAVDSDASRSTDGKYQSERWKKQLGYDDATSGEDDALTGAMPHNKDDSALSPGAKSPRHIRDVIVPFRSWLPAYPRSTDGATES